MLCAPNVCQTRPSDQPSQADEVEPCCSKNACIPMLKSQCSSVIKLPDLQYFSDKNTECSCHSAARASCHFAISDVCQAWRQSESSKYRAAKAARTHIRRLLQLVVLRPTRLHEQSCSGQASSLQIEHMLTWYASMPSKGRFLSKICHKVTPKLYTCRLMYLLMDVHAFVD